MTMDRIAQKRLFLFCLTLVCVVFVAVSASYAFTTNPIAEASVYYNNDVKIEFVNGTSIKNNLPLTYSEGSANAETTEIKISNTTFEKRKIALYVENADKENGIDLSKIYYKINDGIPHIIGNGGEPIYEDTLSRKEVKKLDIKIWVASELVNNLDQGKSSNLRFIVK